jgi:predicted dehydrogenase
LLAVARKESEVFPKALIRFKGGSLMSIRNKIRVGIVGVSPDRGFASIAHIPALQALPEFEITAVCTTRQESAEAAARRFRVPLAFADPAKLAQHPDVDLVTVSVKVPDHYAPVMAAIEAGKHVYCEWPLGRNTDEAARMLAAAERKGVRHAVGLQGQMSPAINYTKDLIADEYVGRVLSATMIACAPNWGATIDRAYQADRANGANLLTITGGHTIDALCHCLGEFREVTAFEVSQRDRIPLEGTGEIIAKTSPDQLVVNGIVGAGAVVSFQVRGGMRRGTEFLFEIHGERGDLQLTATSRASMQRQELNLKGARGGDTALADLPVPAKYRWLPKGVPPDSRYNVAQLYVRLAEGIREGKPVSPGFNAAVTRHHLLDAIVRASGTGMKQVVQR